MLKNDITWQDFVVFPFPSVVTDTIPTDDLSSLRAKETPQVHLHFRRRTGWSWCLHRVVCIRRVHGTLTDCILNGQNVTSSATSIPSSGRVKSRRRWLHPDGCIRRWLLNGPFCTWTDTSRMTSLPSSARMQSSRCLQRVECIRRCQDTSTDCFLHRQNSTSSMASLSSSDSANKVQPVSYSCGVHTILPRHVNGPFSPWTEKVWIGNVLSRSSVNNLQQLIGRPRNGPLTGRRH